MLMDVACPTCGSLLEFYDHFGHVQWHTCPHCGTRVTVRFQPRLPRQQVDAPHPFERLSDFEANMAALESTDDA